MKEGGLSTKRRLEPHALIINWPAWYLLAHDLEREQSRSFRLDRFVHVDITAESFRPRPQQFFQEMKATTGVSPDRV